MRSPTDLVRSTTTAVLAAAAVAVMIAALAAPGCGGDDDDAPAAGDPDASGPGTPDAHIPGPGEPDADVTTPGEADADVPAPGDPPTWEQQFADTGGNQLFQRAQAEGSVTRNVADGAAEDGKVARLRFPGIPALGPGDRVSPQYASELGTNADDFHFGTYRMRVKLASCAPGEEVVNGLFTYFNDGQDHDGDGIDDNSEIDIEILCGTPRVAFLTVWTDYDGATEQFRRETRAIDFSTGDLWEAPNDHEYGLDKIGHDEAFKRPDLLTSDDFIELGFEWHTDRVRYFATIDGQERTLWELNDASHVPQLPAAILFNVWHPGEHWFGGGGAPDYPANDATLSVDWIRYWAE
jgi:hypothetical protein